MRYVVGVLLALSMGAGLMSAPAFSQARGRATLSLAAVESRPLGALGAFNRGFNQGAAPQWP
jgi:hypothetical protein